MCGKYTYALNFLFSLYAIINLDSLVEGDDFNGGGSGKLELSGWNQSYKTYSVCLVTSLRPIIKMQLNAFS